MLPTVLSPGGILILLGVVVFTSGRFMLSCLALCSRVFQSCLALWSPHVWKRELVYVLLVPHDLFVYFALIYYLFLFLFASVVGCGLWLWHSLDVSINCSCFCLFLFHNSIRCPLVSIYPKYIDRLQSKFVCGQKHILLTYKALYICSQVRNMSYASDNCRDGFSLVVTRQNEYIIKIYSVIIFPLVALLHRSLARSLCERTLRRKYLQTVRFTVHVLQDGFVLFLIIQRSKSDYIGKSPRACSKYSYW